MRIIVSADGLSFPLTGIGFYTAELLKGLSLELDAHEVRAWQYGQIKTVESVLASARAIPGTIPGKTTDRSAAGTDNERQRRILGFVRSIAARSKLLVGAYSKYSHYRARATLGNYEKSDVFFSPNYLLPPFPGKKVTTIADLSTLHYPEYHPAARVSLVNSAIRYALSSSDGLITLSAHVRDELCENFAVAREKITVTHLAARPAFRRRESVEIEATLKCFALAENRYFVVAGTIEPRKNIEFVLEAYSQYAQEQGASNAIPLVLVGHSGWKSSHIFERIASLARTLPINYLGYVDDEILVQLLAGALASVYCSKYEGFGLPIVESMQSGTPVICSDHGAMAEVSGKSAIEVSTTDTSGLAEALQKLQDDTAYAELYRNRGLSRAAEFSWEKATQETAVALMRATDSG